MRGTARMKYRVEQKYIITEDKAAYLKYKLEQLMEYDSHAKEGSYRIRSLYFDDFRDSFLEQNQEGNDFRQKYRIRTYNNSKEVIHLEIKKKEFGFTSKQKEELTLKECNDLIFRRQWSLPGNAGEVKKRFYGNICLRGLRPVQIVEYERIPFVEQKGNVRVTLDKFITGSSEVESFWEDILPCIPVLPTGHHILEVKYDEFIPDEIKKILNEVYLVKTAFSKYYYARRNPHV